MSTEKRYLGVRNVILSYHGSEYEDATFGIFAKQS